MIEKKNLWGGGLDSGWMSPWFCTVILKSLVLVLSGRGNLLVYVCIYRALSHKNKDSEANACGTMPIRTSLVVFWLQVHVTFVFSELDVSSVQVCPKPNVWTLTVVGGCFLAAAWLAAMRWRWWWGWRSLTGAQSLLVSSEKSLWLWPLAWRMNMEAPLWSWCCT